ncbi:PAS domain-containing protein [Nisaea sp.]|uniref:PAS domain-containing protein n=1 Tax=Nisaea sp. TaxID=2024842 RepID=UPI003298102A
MTSTSSKDRALSEFRRRIPDVKPEIHSFLGAWLDARGDALVPHRKSFSPMTIPTLLRFVWMYEFDPKRQDFVCQLAGESVNEAWGGNIKGRTIREVVGKIDYPAVKQRWDIIVGQPAIQYGAVEERLTSLETWQAERLLLPMASPDGTINVMLGCSLYSLQRSVPEGTPTFPEHIIRIPCADLQ